jgi:hypothetical protein
MARRIHIGEIDIVRFPRNVFLDDVFDYNPGDHATFLAPFGGGKTQLALDALARVASPDLQATIFVMKPKDSTITKYTTGKNPILPFETIRDWPPSQVKMFKRAFGVRPPGYVLWPRDTGNIDYDEWNQEQVFTRALTMMYSAAKKKPNIMFCDETYSLENELKLGRYLRRSWTKGRSVGNGLWAGSQRPAHIDQLAYQAQHLFLGHDADVRAQDRYAEIGGGIDPIVVKSIIAQLARFEFLYINRDERTMCIIEAS